MQKNSSNGLLTKILKLFPHLNFSRLFFWSNRMYVDTVHAKRSSGAIVTKGNNSLNFFQPHLTLIIELASASLSLLYHVTQVKKIVNALQSHTLDIDLILQSVIHITTPLMHPLITQLSFSQHLSCKQHKATPHSL